jgi:hypothetical protein
MDKVTVRRAVGWLRRRKLVALILVPVVILAFPVYLSVARQGSLNRIYRHVTYEVMADRGSESKKSDLETVSDLMQFLHWQMNVTPDTVAQDRPFLEPAVDGTAYCNQISVGLSHLLAKKGIRSRLAMMRNKDGVSPHSIAEVLVDDRWVVVDPLNGIIPGIEKGGVTVSELSTAFSYIENLSLVQATNHLTGVASDGSPQDDFVEWYRSFAVSPMDPDRPSISFVWGQRPRHRREIRLTGMYYRVLGTVFSSFVQDVYLSQLPAENSTGRKFMLARHYSLHGRWQKALPLYRNVLAAEKNSLREDALFFYGMALIESGDAPLALKSLDTLARDFPDGKWKGIVHFYRGEAMASIGRSSEAREAYRQASPNLLTPAIHRLVALERSTKTREP